MFTYWVRFKSSMDECEKGKTEISKTLKNKCKRQNRNFTFACKAQESVGAPLSTERFRMVPNGSEWHRFAIWVARASAGPSARLHGSRMCATLPGAARSCQELPGAARSCQELPRAARSCQELPGGCQDPPGAARSPELPGVAKSCQELPRAARSCQELLRAARSCQ